VKEFDIQSLLWKEFTKKVKFMFHNIFFFYDALKDGVGRSVVEMDFMTIDNDGYCNEFEIKTSRSDFKEEFLAKPMKHKLLSEKSTDCPNRYYFACPKGIIDINEVPSYAGLIEFTKDSMGQFKMRVARKAPLLHKRLLDPRDLFYKVYYKYYNAQDKEFNNTKKRIRKSDGTKAAEKKRIRKPKRRRFTVAPKSED
jgi:hypothetical protein